MAKYVTSCLIAVLALCGLGQECSTVAAETAAVAISYENCPAREFTPRQGLPNFLAKVKAGKPVKVGYLGGSITAEPKGWRLGSRTWLQRQFPAAKIDEINGTLSGTGSELGVFRLKRDVLIYQPDLLFVEFAVNDDGGNPEKIHRAMEGIVRQTWRTRPDCDICFVYTLTNRHPAILQRGVGTRTQGVMESVADYYGIPSINFGVLISQLEKDGRIIMKSDVAHTVSSEADAQKPPVVEADGKIIFSRDGVHPYPDTGQTLYVQVFARAFENLSTLGEFGSHTLKAPLDRDNWERATMIPLDQVVAPTGGQKLDPANNALAQKVSRRLPQLWQMKPGATLNLRFKGTKIGFYDLLGPGAGMLEITIDGAVSRANRFDSYSDYYRPGMFSAADGLSDTVHTLQVRVLPDAQDKRSLLFTEKQANFDKDPTQYSGTDWYVGAVLLVGEIDQ